MSHLRETIAAFVVIFAAATIVGCGGGGGGDSSSPPPGNGGGGTPPPATAPAPPTNLTAQRNPVQVTHFNLAWTASTGPNVVGYNVYRRLTGQSSFVRIATGVSSTSYSDTSVSPSAAFDRIDYFVRAVNNQAAESSNSNTATIPATIPDGGGPPPPPF